MKRIIIDLDNTLAGPKTDSYADCDPIPEVIEKLRNYKEMGFEITVHTSRNMRSFDNNVGKITAVTVPVIAQWLETHDVPYDEIWVGKPWCGTEGFYVDDRSVRPDEFVNLSPDEISQLIERVKPGSNMKP
ncbi:HAD-IIIC family phosphatase [Leisingera daeponensis]|uniref:HAD-IIIC family phosphatase n=1 Tax=Leisingera daeponensis TaxID=405746 RepID=UPI001C984E8A|nr:HAD-IIIC family phosphatase [Leisingera daeponensis]MBY6059424.1 HAD-IIIC family phosphatase [Leisingera daeponensis]